MSQKVPFCSRTAAPSSLQLKLLNWCWLQSVAGGRVFQNSAHLPVRGRRDVYIGYFDRHPFWLVVTHREREGEEFLLTPGETLAEGAPGHGTHLSMVTNNSFWQDTLPSVRALQTPVQNIVQNAPHGTGPDSSGKRTGQVLDACLDHCQGQHKGRQHPHLGEHLG